TQVKMHREALQRAVSYLVDRKHKLAFIGQIGVGKSAAVSILFSLLVPTDDGKPALERTLLPLGTGRITLCEVEITQAANFAILIEPEPDEEVLRLVSDLFADAWRRTHDPAENNTPSRLTWEVERAIRNMAGLKPGRKGPSGTPDQLDELAKE